MYCSRCGSWAPDDRSTCGLCGVALQVDAPHVSAGLRSISVGPPPPQASPVAVAAVAYGGFWRRLTAMVVDNLVLYFPEAIARVLSGLDLLESNDWTDPREWWLTAFSIALSMLYASILQSSSLEGTLGQRLLDLRITTLDGRRLSFGRALGRFLASAFSIFTCGIGYLVMLWTARRQTLHDLAAGTIVVRGERAPEPAPGVFTGRLSEV